MKFQKSIVPAGLESDDDYDEFGDYIEKKKFHGKPPIENFQVTLEQACATNNVPEIIRALNSGSVTINSFLNGTWTPLMHAAFNGSIDAVTYLLENGADPLLQYDCHNVIMCVCNCSYISKEIDLLKCLKLFIQFDGIDINSKDRIGMSALMYACSNGCLKIIEFLVDHGADIEARDHQNGETALFFAVRFYHVNVVKFLLSRGADKDATDKRCQTIDRIAESKNMADILKLLSADYNNEELEDVFYSEKRSYWKEVMAELENGFRKDVQSFLDILSMEIYTNHLNSNDITFKRLLTGNKNEFLKMGIVLSPHRKLLETALKTFHTRNWSNRSFGVLKNTTSADNIAQTLAIFVRQLHVLDASIMYLSTQSHGLDSQKGQIAMNYLMRIKTLESKLFQILDEQVRMKSVDYIKPHNLPKKNRKIIIKDAIFFASIVMLTVLRIV